MLEKFDADDKGRARDFLGPMATDHLVREVIFTCWMTLPSEKETVDAVEAEVRRIVNRALKDLREDAAAFGIS